MLTANLYRELTSNLKKKLWYIHERYCNTIALVLIAFTPVQW